MRTVKTTGNAKYSRPARRRRGSKYDVMLDTALEQELGSGVVESFSTPEEAKKALNGIRGRRHHRGLTDALDVYISSDGTSVVVTPKPEEDVEDLIDDSPEPGEQEDYEAMEASPSE